jgi:hypothetical protein
VSRGVSCKHENPSKASLDLMPMNTVHPPWTTPLVGQAIHAGQAPCKCGPAVLRKEAAGPARGRRWDLREAPTAAERPRVRGHPWPPRVSPRPAPSVRRIGKGTFTFGNLLQCKPGAPGRDSQAQRDRGRHRQQIGALPKRSAAKPATSTQPRRGRREACGALACGRGIASPKARQRAQERPEPEQPPAPSLAPTTR